MGAEDGQKRRAYAEAKWRGRVKESLAAIFLTGPYQPAINALLELSDNAINYRNTHTPTPTIVTINFGDDRLTVTDYGGDGANLEGIQKFFHMGESERKGISIRGVGGKFAAFFFADDVSLRAKKAGEPEEYRAEMKSFGDPNFEYEGQIPIDISLSTLPIDKGSFEIILKRLKKFSGGVPKPAAIIQALSEVYRPLLTRQAVALDRIGPVEPRVVVDADNNLQEVKDKVIMFVRTSRHRHTQQVKPLEIPLLPEYSEDDIQIAMTSNKEPLWYWAGDMDLRQASNWVKAGIRFYYNGRLLTTHNCGIDLRDPRLAGLVGEVHLDHVKGITEEFSPNKSAGINLESTTLKNIITTMQKSLKPLVEKLKQKPLISDQKTPLVVTKALQHAKHISEATLRLMAEQGGVINQDDLTLLTSETEAQRLPVARNVFPGQGSPPKGPGHFGPEWPLQKGRTLPTLDASRGIKRRRKAIVEKVVFGSFDDPKQVSGIGTMTEDGQVVEVLILNREHPKVQLADVLGEIAYTTLICDEMAHHLARTFFSKDLEKYINFRTDFEYSAAQMLTNSAAYRDLIIKRQKTSSS